MTDTQKLEMLRAAVSNVLSDNYPNPRNYRGLHPNKCKHERMYYEDCVNCIDEYLEAALEACK